MILLKSKTRITVPKVGILEFWNLMDGNFGTREA